MAQVPFVTSPALIAIGVQYMGINRTARGYIADRVAPRFQTEAADFRYPEFKIEEAFTVYDDQVDRLGRLNEITQSSTEATGSVIDHGILEKVPYRDEMQARAGNIPFSRRSLAVRHVIDVIQMNREIRVAGLTMNLNNYATGYKTDVSVSTDKWDAYATSDPVTQVKDAARGMLVPPNVGITTRRVLDKLAVHPKISVALGGSAQSGRMVSDAEIARLFGLERIEVASTIKQTSTRGQALTTGPIWADSFAMHYQGPMDGSTLLDGNSPNFLTTFQWGGIVAGENTYRPGEMGLYGGVGVYTGESLVEKRVAPMAGYLFANVLSS